MRRVVALDEELARLDPQYRIRELEHEAKHLRAMLAEAARNVAIEQAADGFAMDLIARGIRAGDTRFSADGRTY